jgi:hypothetical protein
LGRGEEFVKLCVLLFDVHLAHDVPDTIH